VGHRPWTLTLKDDGKYYGRGTCDMKAFYAIALAMLPQILKAPLKKPIHFALSYDEEVGCLGAHSLAAAMARGSAAAARHHHRRADHDDGGARPQGRADVRHQVHRLRGAFLDDPSRRQRHPFRRRVRHYLNTVQDELDAQFPPTSEFTPPAPTFNVGTIVGGTAGNILARECEVLWGYRELPHRPLERARRPRARLAAR
jgi:acetylornithine deacetylase